MRRYPLMHPPASSDLARTTDRAVVIATGDPRRCANLLLTISVVGVTPRKEQRP